MSERGVAAIVVAYGRADLLERLLSQVADEVPVAVVDNSSLEAVRLLCGRYGATYVDPGRNMGFAAGVNVGLDHVDDGRDVLLVNPDAVVTPGAVRALSAFLHAREHARVAAVAPRLVDEDGREQRVAWPFPSPWRAWVEAVGMGRLPARSPYVVGTVLLIRREALDEVGGFDERFFLYTEEADWQRRARRTGWVSRLCSDAEAQHVGAATSDDPVRREILFHAAHETYIRKWYGTAGWWLYRTAAILGATARAGLLRGDRRRAASRRASLYRRGPRRVMQLTAE